MKNDDGGTVRMAIRECLLVPREDGTLWGEDADGTLVLRDLAIMPRAHYEELKRRAGANMPASALGLVPLHRNPGCGGHPLPDSSALHHDGL